jgi:hypothetical protein
MYWRFIFTVLSQFIVASWVFHCHRTQNFRRTAIYFIISHGLFVGNIYAVYASLHESFWTELTRPEAITILVIIVLSSLPLGLVLDRILSKLEQIPNLFTV